VKCGSTSYRKNTTNHTLTYPLLMVMYGRNLQIVPAERTDKSQEDFMVIPKVAYQMADLMLEARDSYKKDQA